MPRKPPFRLLTQAECLALPEDERIRRTQHYIVLKKEAVSLLVTDEAPTVARYQRKLMARGCVIHSITKGPAEGLTTIRVGPRDV